MKLTKSKTKETPTLRSRLADLFDADAFFDHDVLDAGWPRLDSIWKSRVPAANITENDNQFDIELAAPGMNKKDFKVNVQNGNLVISAEKEEEKEEKEKDYCRKEYNYSSFRRSFSLPESVNADAVKAEYKDGILKLTVPKKEEAKKQPKKEIAIS